MNNHGIAHYIKREEQNLYLWEKLQAGVEKHIKKTNRVVLFMHGATWSGRPNFDLQIRDYSIMDYFAFHGWDAFCLDIQGYGQSNNPKGENYSQVSSAVGDIEVAVNYISSLRSVEAICLVGYSWGCQTAGFFSMGHPDQVRRLVLYGFNWSNKLSKKALQGKIDLNKKYRMNDNSYAASDFIPGAYEEDVLQLFVSECMKYDSKTPTGAIRDMVDHLPILNPEKLLMPCLLINGEYEAIRNPGFEHLQDQMRFFNLLPNSYKNFLILGGGGHAIHLEKPHIRWLEAVHTFLEKDYK